MLSKVKHYLFQLLSFIFVAYGFYLLYLFLLDTTLRVSRDLAYPLSLGITLLLATLTLVYWIKKKRLPF
ncbi:MAG: hypothetical protein RMK21_01730 [Aquificaceae bacterium]|nr:hypothetical protein [Aquificaceae bacterium]MDW8294058.1 hypothetical protein [Aquificaceae bacterium]